MRTRRATSISQAGCGRSGAGVVHSRCKPRDARRLLAVLSCPVYCTERPAKIRLLAMDVETRGVDGINASARDIAVANVAAGACVARGAGVGASTSGCHTYSTVKASAKPSNGSAPPHTTPPPVPTPLIPGPSFRSAAATRGTLRRPSHPAATWSIARRGVHSHFKFHPDSPIARLHGFPSGAQLAVSRVWRMLAATRQ